MNNLTNEFDFIFEMTVNQYIERKNFIENIGKTSIVPKNITKTEIYRAYMASIYALIIELQCNELLIHDIVILSDSPFETSRQLFEGTLYPRMASCLRQKGIEVINPEQ